MNNLLDCKELRSLLNSRKPPVRLLAVSKGQSVDKIRALYLEGQREFGENYLVELEEKADALKDLPDLRWVFIGQLQSNKIQRVVRVADEIQSVASEKHVRYISRYAAEIERQNYPIFLEVNCDEEQKGGADQATAVALSAVISADYKNLDLRGLMSIPPEKYSDAFCQGNVPSVYSTLASLAKSIGRGELSLGMTGDREIALKAGSTCLRIGRALFGARPVLE